MQITGIITFGFLAIVGCSSPKVGFEKGSLTITTEEKFTTLEEQYHHNNYIIMQIEKATSKEVGDKMRKNNNKFYQNKDLKGLKQYNEDLKYVKRDLIKRGLM